MIELEKNKKFTTRSIQLVFVFIFILPFEYAISQNIAIPAGTVIAYGGSSAPAGWLLCDGAAYNTSTYSNLFAAIGSTFGSNVPDLRGRFVRGANPGQINADADASNVGDFLDDKFDTHDHSLTVTNANTTTTHTHTHTHSETLENATLSHTHAVSVTSSSNSVVHNHGGTTNAVADHTHTVNHEFRAGTTTAPGSGTVNVWRNLYSGGAAMGNYTPPNDPNHSHTLGNNSGTHTHRFPASGSITTGSADASAHYHASINLPSITSSGPTAQHSHVASFSGTSGSYGTGTETYPDNVSVNFIIKY